MLQGTKKMIVLMRGIAACHEDGLTEVSAREFREKLNLPTSYASYNQCLTQCRTEGYVKYRKINTSNNRYALTPKGRKFLLTHKLVQDYTAEIFKPAPIGPDNSQKQNLRVPKVTPQVQNAMSGIADLIATNDQYLKSLLKIQSIIQPLIDRATLQPFNDEPSTEKD